MKKWIAMMLVALMAFALAGCEVIGNAGETAETDAGYKLVEPGKLLVALSPDFAPMEFVDTSKEGQEQFVGFDVTLANFIADQLGLELEIRPMAFDACQTAVQMKAVDMSISGYSKTEERAANFSLSDFYYAGENETQQVIIVPAEKAGTYSAAADFAGLKVGAQIASLQENLCNTQLEGVTVELFKDINDAVMAMQTGKLDAVAVAYGNGQAIIANNPNIGMSGFEFEVDEEQSNNVIMLNKDSVALTEKVNEILAIAYENGYYGQWYADAKALAGIETAADVSFDAEGNAVG